MRNATISQIGLFGLIGHFRDEIKILIRQEVELAKAELSEKISRLGSHAVWLAVGGLAGFAGLIILLASLSSLLSFVFEKLGMQPSLAFFLGALIIGGGTASVGIAFVLKALKRFSKETLAPEKTLVTIKKLKGEAAVEKPELRRSTSEIKRSSDEIAASIETTRKEAGDTAEEITERLKPRHMRQVLKKKIQEHPVRSSVIGAGTGLMGFLVLRRRWRHARA